MGRFHGCRLDKTGVPALRRKRRGLACGDINFSSGSSKRDGPGACMRGGIGFPAVPESLPRFGLPRDVQNEHCADALHAVVGAGPEVPAVA